MQLRPMGIMSEGGKESRNFVIPSLTLRSLTASLGRHDNIRLMAILGLSSLLVSTSTRQQIILARRQDATKRSPGMIMSRLAAAVFISRGPHVSQPLAN